MRGRATTTPTDTAPHRFLVAARLLINISRHRFALVRVNIGILALLGIETGIVVGLGLGFDAFATSPSTTTSASHAPATAPFGYEWPIDAIDLPYRPQQGASASRAAHKLPKPVEIEDYFQIRESDFATTSEPADVEIDDASSGIDPQQADVGFEAPMPDIVPPVPTYEATVDSKKPKRRRRKTVHSTDLPVLPAGVQPPDGHTRFDWRASSLSRRPHAKGNYWFPNAAKTRIGAPITKLTEIDPFFPELRRYSEHFIPLLEAEQSEAERQFNVRLKEWPEDKLRREGFMIDDLAASTAWQPKFKVEGVVVTFTKTGAEATRPLPPHQFEPGSTVILSRTDPLKDPWIEDDTVVKGYVFSHGRGNVRVIFPPFPAEMELGLWRLDIGCSDFAFRRQLEALTRLNLDPVQQDMAFYANRKPSKRQSVEDEVLNAVRKQNEEQVVLTGTALRDLLLRRFQVDYETPSAGPGDILDPDGLAQEVLDMKPEDVDATVSPTVYEPGVPGVLMRNQLIKSWTTRYLTPEGKEPLVVGGDPVVPLNPSQTRAIAMMLSERLSLVQGPPGTGKTRVIVEAIKLLKQHWQVPQPILVTAHTNVAVDHLLDGLREHGLKAVRFGSSQRVPDELQHLTFEERLEEHPLWLEMESIKGRREMLQNEMSNNAKMSKMMRDSKKQEVNRLNGRIFGLRSRIRFEVLANADVICTTCLSATSRILDAIDFPMVFLDEASMATEPLTLVPLTKGSAQVAIIGDHKQLPPVIVSEEGQSGGLATSMFERLIHEKHIPSIMLDTQYRMHPSISSFSSNSFYNATLKDGTVLADGSIRPGLEPPVTDFLMDDANGDRMNVTFLNHDFPESPLNMSIANHHEAGRVCDIIGDLLSNNPDLKGKDIGVIAPYVAQIRTISDMLALDPERAAAYEAWLGEERAREVADIEVKTVDGFEGREKSVIIFSTVRSNAAGYIGFLADWRRLNVGLTRARRALIMIGSARTLRQARVGRHASETLPRDGAKVWHRFMKHLEDGGMVMDDMA